MTFMFYITDFNICACVNQKQQRLFGAGVFASLRLYQIRLWLR